MKRLSITMVAVAALVVGTTPAFADNKGHGKPSPSASASPMSVGQAKQYEVELTGTVLTTNGTNSLTMKAKTASKPKALKNLALAILRAASLTVNTDTKTVVKRGGSRVFSAIKVNDKVNIRAKCTMSPLACVATRITATAGPTPKPSGAADSDHYKFSLTGRIVHAPTGANDTFTVTVTKSEFGESTNLRSYSVNGTNFTIRTDTSTVVESGTATITYTQLVNLGAVMVSVQGTCTSTSVCTASRIRVPVPTP